MRRIVQSLLMMGLVATAVLMSSSAFFSDTKTSTNNVFQAGGVGISIGHEGYYNKQVDGVPNTDSWEFDSLSAKKFFNFDDVKPGDFGTSLISLLPESNDVWACVSFHDFRDDENSCTLSEIEDEMLQGTVCTEGAGNGDLGSEIYLSGWLDDGDGVWSLGESLLFHNQVVVANSTLDNQIYAIADSVTNGLPLTAGDETQIGLSWCFGQMTIDSQTGMLDCDGSGVGNASQTDSLTVDVTFMVEQSRNNPTFNCTQQLPPPIVSPTITPTPTLDPNPEIVFAFENESESNFQSQTIPSGYKSITFNVFSTENIINWAPLFSLDGGESYFELHRFSCFGAVCPEVTVPILSNNYKVSIGTSSGLITAVGVLNIEPEAKVMLFDTHMPLPYTSGDIDTTGYTTIAVSHGEPGYGSVSGVSLQKYNGAQYVEVATTSCPYDCNYLPLSVDGGLFRVVLNGSGQIGQISAILRP